MAGDLTFGLELEFIILGKREEIAETVGAHADTDLAGAAVVHSALQGSGAAGISSRIDTGAGTLRLMRYCDEYEMSGGTMPEPNATYSNANQYQKWTIDTDGSVDLTSDERELLPRTYHAYPVELKTPIFSLAHDNWLEQITTVLDVLHTTLNSGRDGSSIRVLTNETCGLHVHVGKSADGSQRFSVRAIKNLFQLVTAFERVIDELHAAPRVTERARMTYCAPPSARFKAFSARRSTDVAALRDAARGGPADWCACIERVVASLTDLHTITKRVKCAAYNFNNTTPMLAAWGPAYQAAMKWTVEFRQHRGTLDAREALAWLAFVAALVAFAERVEYPELERLIATRVADPTFTLEQFLRTLGAEEELVAFYTSRPDGAGAGAAAKDFSGLQAGAVDGPLTGLLDYNRATASKEIAERKQAIVKKLLNGGYGNFGPDVLRNLSRAYLR